MKVKIGVIGAGHFGRYHIMKLLTLPEADLVGFFDIDRGRSEQIARELKVRAFSDPEELLAQCSAVSVVVPTAAHFPVVRDVILHRRHVFCEKPFMLTTRQADAIVQLARSSKITLQVGHIERFNPAFTSLQAEAVNPRFIEAHRLAPFGARGTDVSVILELMIHDIDLVLNLVKAPIRQVEAVGANILTQNIDLANARLKFANGCLANLTASRVATKSVRRLRIFQPDACFNLDFLMKKTELVRLVNDPERYSIHPAKQNHFREGQWFRGLVRQELAADPVDALREELRHFIGSVQGHHGTTVSGEDGRQALAVANRIEKQILAKLKRVN